MEVIKEMKKLSNFKIMSMSALVLSERNEIHKLPTSHVNLLVLKLLHFELGFSPGPKLLALNFIIFQ